jgi:SulP family sulfate permease
MIIGEPEPSSAERGGAGFGPAGGRALWPRLLGDVSGAFADLGTFLPLVIGLLLLNRVDPSGLLVGFGLFALATGAIYRLPMPVQPMKAVAAVAIAGGLDAAAMTASGLLLGVTLLVLGLTGLIGRLDRLVPRTVLFGIQLGLGLQLVLAAIGLAEGQLWLAALALLALLLFQASARLRPVACLLLLAGAVLWSLAAGAILPPAAAEAAPFGLDLGAFRALDAAAFGVALETVYLPQLALTVTNAVLLTAALSADLFPEHRARVSPKRLALSSGALNILLAPLGAMPMCHGAGGLAAQYHQGARTGLAPALFGSACLLLALLAGTDALAWLLLVPMPVVAVVLAYAGIQLAYPRRLAGLRPQCLTIIALTALTAVFWNVAVALVAGLLAEHLRSTLNARRQPTV